MPLDAGQPLKLKLERLRRVQSNGNWDRNRSPNPNPCRIRNRIRNRNRNWARQLTDRTGPERATLQEVRPTSPPPTLPMMMGP